MLARKPKNAPVHPDRVQAPQVARSVLFGAGVLALAGGIFGLLAGLGVIPVPGVEAATYRTSTGFVLGSVAAGILAGGVTGAILGAAIRLMLSRDKVAITSRGVKRGGLLLVVRLDEGQRETVARQIMQDNGAVDFQNLTDRWDPQVWSEFDKLPAPGRQ